MTKIRCAVIGTGHGMAHIVRVLEHTDLELAAVCASSQTSLDYLRGAFVPTDLESVTFTAPRAELIKRARSFPELASVKLTTDYKSVLQMGDVDAVILSVPIYMNASCAIDALMAGKHVLAEKPFAINEEQGVELLKAVKNSNRAFVLAFEFRRSPLMQRVKGIIDSGELGEVKQLWWNMHRMPLRATHCKRERTGGSFLVESCHWFDLFDFFQGGAQFDRVASFGGLDASPHQDFADNAVTIVEYNTGVRASLNFSYFADLPEHNVFGVVGTRGKLRGDTDQAGRCIVYSGQTQDRSEYVVNPTIAHRGHLGFDLVHDDLVAQVEGDRSEAMAEAERGLENLRLCLAAEEALASRRVIERREIASRWLKV